MRLQSCSKCRGMKLMSHTIKTSEKVVEARFRKLATFCEQQCGFMPRRSIKDVPLRMRMESYTDDQKEFHCVCRFRKCVQQSAACCVQSASLTMKNSNAFFMIKHFWHLGSNLILTYSALEMLGVMNIT